MSEKKERLIFDVAYQPQVRTNVDTRRLMSDVLVAMIPIAIVAVYRYGWQVLLLMLVGMASATFFEWAYRFLLKKSITIDDFSAAVSGLLLVMVLPPQTPWWMVVIGTFFAIVIVKQLYGGIGRNFLNPALAGRAFLLASYATLMATWNIPKALSGTVDGVTMATPLAALDSSDAPGVMPAYFSTGKLFMGYIPGSMGEISTLAILIGAGYLIYRDVISWRIPVSFIGTLALLTLVFGHEGFSNGQWMVYNLFSGSALFGACFMATDYATSPVTLKGQLLFGAGCGLLTVLIRYFGGFPEGTTYAILIMNLCTWAIDKGFHRHQFGVSKADILLQKAQALAEKEARR